MSEINFDSELDALLVQEETNSNQPAAEVPQLDIPEFTTAVEETDTEEAVQDVIVEETEIPKKPKTDIFKKIAGIQLLKKKEAPRRTPRKSEETAEAPVAAGKFQAAPARPERRPRMSKEEMFKQNTLPLIILAVAALLIVIFIIGSITRAIQKHTVEKEASIAVSESVAEEQARLEAEMNSILQKAAEMADGYDFEGAVALIDSFSGNIGGYPQLQDARARYEYSKESLVPWTDPNSIINLSFQTLIADTDRAFSHEEYGSSLKKNFVTTEEFQKILERLYENDYILVNLSDLVETVTSESGSEYYQYKELLLPDGKKPLVLTQTNVNYNLYLVDSNDDLVADKDGVGIASKMVLDASGNVTCEIVNADGTTSTGAYDLVPILDAFVNEHPDFSYRGAKAVLALTGYNGLFGYRTHTEARAVLGEEQYEQDVASVQAIANALTESGYELACYTYGNNAYGKHSVSQIQSDMNKWLEEVVPILGTVDIMVFAQNSDINSGMLYSGSKFDYLKAQGFNYFLGFCSEGDPFTLIAENYVRQGRLMVTGSNLKNNAKWFNAIFDTENLLDETRG